jgi:hypothetical protein
MFVDKSIFLNSVSTNNIYLPTPQPILLGTSGALTTTNGLKATLMLLGRNLITGTIELVVPTFTSSASTLVSTTAIPTQFRPLVQKSFASYATSNAVSFPISVSISTAGIVTVGFFTAANLGPVSGTPNFAAGATSQFYSCAVSYTLD